MTVFIRNGSRYINPDYIIQFYDAGVAFDTSDPKNPKPVPQTKVELSNGRSVNLNMSAEDFARIFDPHTN